VSSHLSLENFTNWAYRHEAQHYTDDIENDMCVFVFFLQPVTEISVVSIEAMSHPRCVGWGEMGLDYHYDNSPRDIQRSVFRRQLKQAVKLGKPLTIHTREADQDTESILKEVVPKDHKVPARPIIS
jgi:TatD DNase family protein